ncbi:hypothetical protein F5050DRAFT_1710356 [Lentinula boryana]|uniref:Uncharacterized protein n=1 Tax=Lentinula boryana TaxID=40481 RepID=A0ABQ8QJP9_9AGAR|nr:hypothetical protein F5050DRAFT_1710356 [Lentinula boryana]
MHFNRSYGVVLKIVIILGLVSVALAAALSPILEHPSSKSSLDASSQTIRPTVDVTFHGNFPGDDVSRSARIDVQSILYEAARKIYGTPDLSINKATWDAKQQSTKTEKITFEASVSGLRPEDCGIYTGFYYYSGVLSVPKARKSKSKPAKPNDRIERILTAQLLGPQGTPLLDLKVPEGRILQTDLLMNKEQDGQNESVSNRLGSFAVLAVCDPFHKLFTMHWHQLHGLCIIILNILGLVPIATGAPVSSESLQFDAAKPVTVSVLFHGDQPVDEGIMQMARVNVQSIAYLAARQMPGTPDLTVHKWEGNPQASPKDKHVTFSIIVNGLGKQDGAYPGYYIYSGVPIPDDMERIKRSMTAKLINPQGQTVVSFQG